MERDVTIFKNTTQYVDILNYICRYIRMLNVIITCHQVIKS